MEPRASVLSSGLSGPARWFDGLSTQGRDVDVRLDGEQIQWIAAEASSAQRCSVAALGIGEPWPNAPLPLALPDGGTLWLGAEARALQQALVARTRPRHAAMRWIESWRAVTVCVLAIVLLLVWFDRQGAGLAATAVMNVMPRGVDQAIGVRAEALLRKQWLSASLVPRERQAALQQRFIALAKKLAPEVPVSLEFARVISERGLEAGFNAFALPNGAVFLLDGMVQQLSDDELMAVLGHELGHIVHRHSLRAVVRGLGLLTAATAVLGDFSGLATTTVAGVQALHYSRDAEREADAYARQAVAAAGLPPGVLAGVWRKLMAEEQRRSITGMPAWLSTHPTTDERLRDAARP